MRGRIALTMLMVAAVVLLGLAIALAVLGDPPEVGGWLRATFGKVFGVVAISLAAVLGIPAGIGLWAMAGANADAAVPALSDIARKAVIGVAVATVAVTAVVLLVTGSAVTILNIALLALVALASLGLADAAAVSPHRWRATSAAIAVVVVAAGTAWILFNAFLGPSPV